MRDYYRRLLNILPEGDLERRTDLKTGNEAIYRDGVFLFGDSTDKLPNPDLTEKIVPEPHLVLFGCGHVGKALYDLAVLQDMRITVLDSREGLLTEERLPKAERILGDYDDLLAREYESFIAPYFCIFTHGHLNDEACLLYCLRHPHSYIGMIGSKKKIAHCMGIMHENGVTDDMLRKLYTPIGLPINAVTPQEIAVAIMAQIISVFRADKSAITIDASLVSKAANNKGIMARIVHKEGSSPRSVGSMMFITESDLYGTVGGGAVELKVIETARQMLNENRRLLVETYSLTIQEPLSMTCGGENTILYKLVD